MESFGEFILLLLRQFAGGPGPTENNLVRFGLPALLWLALWVVAWSRQRSQALPRERLLVVGFGLAFAREVVMFALITGSIVGWKFLDSENVYHHPLEHALAMAAIIVVAGAYLRYALDDERVSRRYLQVGIGATAVATAVVIITWPSYATANPEIQFHHTWQAWVFHVPLSLMIAGAINILARKQGWLRNTVILAMLFFFISEFIILVNFATDHSYSRIICPIGNSLHILAIPLLGFVYLKEQSIEKDKAEKELVAYRDHLKDLVEERTSMLVAQHEIAESLSQSLDLETILNMALDKILPVLSMEVGLIFLLDQNQQELTLAAYRGKLTEKDLELCIKEGCPYKKISMETIEQEKVIIQTSLDEYFVKSTHIKKEGIQTLVSSPLISKNQTVGTLALGSRSSDPIDPTNLELLTAICNQISMAIENANLYQESELWAKQLGMLHKVSVDLSSTLNSKQVNQEIAIRSAKLTDRPIACVFFWEENLDDPEIISCFGMESEAEELIAKDAEAIKILEELRTTKKSICIDRLQTSRQIPRTWKEERNIHSLFCSPIWGINEPVEFLFIMDIDATRPWRSKDVELVESFVSRAAVALEKANLIKKLEWAAALEERQRIAADVHDGLAQTISLLGLKVDQTTELLQSKPDPKMLQALKEIRNTVDQTSIEVRKSISSLQNNPLPKQTLQEILISLVEQQSQNNNFVLRTSISIPEPLFLPPEHTAQVIPIVQEAIHNAINHSNASTIEILGQQTDGTICITIEDDGCGFNMDKLITQEQDHFGVRIMRARAARFGGILEIFSEPNQGTTVKLSWALNPKTKGGTESSRQNDIPKEVKRGGETVA